MIMNRLERDKDIKGFCKFGLTRPLCSALGRSSLYERTISSRSSFTTYNDIVEDLSVKHDY